MRRVGVWLIGFLFPGIASVSDCTGSPSKKATSAGDDIMTPTLALSPPGGHTVPTPRLLILETSGRRAQVALAEGPTLLAVRSLDEARRHARDLAPTVAALLAQQQ